MKPIGFALAMQVLQSDLYPKLDEEARAECDAIIAAHQTEARARCEAAMAEYLAAACSSFPAEYTDQRDVQVERLRVVAVNLANRTP